MDRAVAPPNARFACDRREWRGDESRHGEPSDLIERDRNRRRPICLNFGGERAGLLRGFTFFRAYRRHHPV